MLELPEVVTLSKQVNDVLTGRTITQVFMPQSRINLRSTTAIRWNMVNCWWVKPSCRPGATVCLSIFISRTR